MSEEQAIEKLVALCIGSADAFRIMEAWRKDTAGDYETLIKLVSLMQTHQIRERDVRDKVRSGV